MRRAWWIGLAVMAGCYAPRSEAPCTVSCNGVGSPCPGDQVCLADHRCHEASGGCGPIDAPVGTSDTGPPYCFGGGLVQVCFDTISQAAITLPSFIETTTSTACAPHEPLATEACVVFGRTITDRMGAVRAQGALPLILVATETIDLTSGLDLSSHVGSVNGAGGNPIECVPPVAPTLNGGGAGGAAGGTFQGSGGQGGSAGGGHQGTPSTPVTFPTHLRGGCDGGLGINGAGALGRQGLGGGAVYLIAGSAINVAAAARINVSGSGATGGDGSGNGGGAGGMIGLDAVVFAIQGELMANGGGGSAGFDGTTADGNDSSNPTIGGIGGSTNGAGKGGNGAGGSTMPLVGAVGGSVTLPGNGGGGGGGGGFILVHPSSAIPGVSGANVSPPPR
jgi:hypothetical protein